MDHMENPPRRRGARQRISNLSQFQFNNDRFVPNGFAPLAANNGDGSISDFDIGKWKPDFDIGEWEPVIETPDRTAAVVSDMNFEVGVFDPQTDISEEEVRR